MRDVDIGRIVLRVRGIDSAEARGLAERLGPRLLERLSEGTHATPRAEVDAGRVLVQSGDALGPIVEQLVAAVERGGGS